MGLVDDIKNQVKKSGTNKSKFLYFKEGVKVRVRFLDDMEDGHKVRFHDSFQLGINVPCQEEFDRECPYCEDDELRTRDQYAWSVWDYDAKEVKVLMAPVNQCSPVPALVSMFEAYGTLKDRDYVITKSGKQQSTTYSVVPMDKAKFRNEKAKPLSDQKFLQTLDKAFPCDASEDDDDDYKPKKSSKRKQPKPKYEEPDDNDEWEDDDAEGEEEIDYYELSPKELYKLCKERDIDVVPKKPAKYYITKLEDDDSKREDGWDEEDDDDEWED